MRLESEDRYGIIGGWLWLSTRFSLTQMANLGIDLFGEKLHDPVAVHGQVDVRRSLNHIRGRGKIVLMSRGPRLDTPGVLHHAMARGIMRQAIFHDKVVVTMSAGSNY